MNKKKLSFVNRSLEVRKSENTDVVKGYATVLACSTSLSLL